MKKIVTLKTYKKNLIELTDYNTDYNLRKFLINDLGNDNLQNIIDTTSAFFFYILNSVCNDPNYLQTCKETKVSIKISIKRSLFAISNGTIDWFCDYWLHPIMLTEDMYISEMLLKKAFKVKSYEYNFLDQDVNQNYIVVISKLKEELENLYSYFGIQDEEEIKRILKL